MPVSIERITDAIKNREILDVSHQTTNPDGSNKKGHPHQHRKIIPVAVGVNQNTGNALVRAFQIGGATNSNPLQEFKLYKLEHMSVSTEPNSDKREDHFNAKASLLSDYRPNDSAFSQSYALSNGINVDYDGGSNIIPRNKTFNNTANTQFGQTIGKATYKLKNLWNTKTGFKKVVSNFVSKHFK